MDLALFIAAVVLLVLNTFFWVNARKGADDGSDVDISGFIPELVRALCCLAWCWWFAARAGRAGALQLYELLAFDLVMAVGLGIFCLIATIAAVKDALARYWI